jgi:hypothetical protein
MYCGGGLMELGWTDSASAADKKPALVWEEIDIAW